MDSTNDSAVEVKSMKMRLLELEATMAASAMMRWRRQVVVVEEGMIIITKDFQLMCCSEDDDGRGECRDREEGCGMFYGMEDLL